jgi:enoyl-CoA hydratase
MPTIIVETPAPGITRVVFDRPEVRNALNRQMVDELRAAMDELARSREARVLIFAGSDTVFASGADIAELRDRDKMDALAFINTGLFRDIQDFPLPTIAAIRGWALGGGCELAAACDLRVAGRGARFGQPEVKLGILPGAGATYRLPRLIGSGNARDLIFTGRTIDADEALRMGLVNRVVDDDDVLNAATSLANDIAANAPLALRFAKMALNVSAESSDRAGMYLEATAQAVLFEDDEKQERMTAFLESRSGKSKR